MFLYRVKFLESRASRRQNAQAGQGAKNGGNTGRYTERAPSPLPDPALYADPMFPPSTSYLALVGSRSGSRVGSARLS